MKVPKAIRDVIESFEKLPGVGPKSAQRLTFYLLHVPQSELDAFAASLTQLKKNTTLCSICYTVGESDPCDYCSDAKREAGLICVVEQALDVLAIEKSGHYHGVYHVLHGRIDPLNNIGPDEIYLPQLLARIRTNDPEITEVILATNPTMEGEATAMYISKQIKIIIESELPLDRQVKVTRIGRGLPVGADLEYADSITLDRALEGRSEY